MEGFSAIKATAMNMGDHYIQRLLQKQVISGFCVIVCDELELEFLVI
jgi:hypothetical protein